MVSGAELVSSVELQISLLLFVSLLGYLIAQRIGQSIVIGEILVGIVIGPSLLGWITYTSFIQSTATMGAIFLLFVVGLQTKFKEIYTLKAGVIALIGVIVPWLGGYWLAKAFGYNLVSSIYVGTALTATSIAITAHVLKEMGKLDTPAAKAIIGAAVIDDVLGLLALSMTAQFAANEISVSSILWMVFAAGAFLTVGLWVGIKYVSPALLWLNKWAVRRGLPQMTFIAAIAFAFFYSVLAELVGLSAIVGAFVAGVSFENLKIKSYREGAEYLEVIFASIFFVSLGILVDLSAAMGAVVFLGAITLVGILTKLIGCSIPARFFGLGTRDSIIVGLGMVPRGEVAMIVALIGLNSKMIGQEVYAAILVMALITTMVPPIFIKRLYRK